MTDFDPTTMMHDGAGARQVLPAGALLATPGAIEALRLAAGNPGADGPAFPSPRGNPEGKPVQHTLDDLAHTILVRLYHRHLTGDWGECGPEDWATNDGAIQHDSRVLSVYSLPRTGETLWLITEAGHRDGAASMTTALLPSEY